MKKDTEKVVPQPEHTAMMSIKLITKMDSFSIVFLTRLANFVEEHNYSDLNFSPLQSYEDDGLSLHCS